MIFTLKIFLIIFLGIIFYQDIKFREVYWFLFPIIGILMSLIFIKATILNYFLLNIYFNIALVSFIVFILFLCSKIVFKKKFLNHSFGLGDLLFFFSFSLGFPSVTFIILFTFSILFSLLMHLILKSQKQIKTVPLAGFMSAFLIFVYLYTLVSDNQLIFLNYL